ncbi:MAG TPA: hypothetical protein VJ603_04900 [Paucimonas sp.]|nr:hypothetical protein [Paucimonas sp.]
MENRQKGKNKRTMIRNCGESASLDRAEKQGGGCFTLVQQRQAGMEGVALPASGALAGKKARSWQIRWLREDKLY